MYVVADVDEKKNWGRGKRQGYGGIIAAFGGGVSLSYILQGIFSHIHTFTPPH